MEVVLTNALRAIRIETPPRPWPRKGAQRAALRLGRLGELAGYHLRRASAAFAADFRDVLGATGLRQVHVGILAVLEANPNVRQGNVGALLGIKSANMVPLIDDLVGKGLVERVVTPDDRRALSLSITAAGAETLGSCWEQIGEHEDRMLARLDAGERATLLALLARVGAAGE